MSCGCENKRLSREYERILRLAKAFARMEGITVVIFMNEDRSYGFQRADIETDKEKVEYITPY